MVATYETEAAKVRSEKITLVTIESVERAKLFTATMGGWYRQTKYFVVGVKEDGESIEFTFNAKTKVLFIAGADPKTRDIVLVYRHFFSNASVNLPFDLDEGEAVEWDGKVNSIGAIGQQLDEENTGIVLESSSSVELENTDAFFDSIFDTHIWENQNIVFYSWFPTTPVTEKKQLFEGVVESKGFSEKKITFKVKDFVYKLKNTVNLGIFTEDDGRILPSLLNTAKRRIYGQADGVKCVSIVATLDGYDIGQVTGSAGSLILTGLLTSFLEYVSPGDEIFVPVSGVTFKLGVESVDSDYQITLTKALEVSIPATNAIAKPATPFRYLNRRWMIAGHKLRARSAEILIPVSANTFIVDSVEEFFAGDEIVINGFQTNVRRVSGKKIFTTTNVGPIPAQGDFIVKRAVKKVFLGTRELTYDRDFIDYTFGGESFIQLSDIAEFNIAEQRLVGVNLTWTNGSRTLTTASTVDLRTIMKPRDWIRSSHVSRPDWYEILAVKEQTVILRTPVGTSTITEGAYYKSVDVIDENSLVTVNCIGMDAGDVWMKTPSDVVRNLVLNDAGFVSVNEEAFEKAKADCNFIVSMVIPEALGTRAPVIRDVITNINNSVFGSLYGDSSSNISYSILNSIKPELNPVRDDDINGFTIQTSQKIVNRVTVHYRPSVDRFSGEDSTIIYIQDSEFVNEVIGIKNEVERKLYLYETDKAVIIAQRIALFNSMSTSTIKIKGKMNLAGISVNDKIYLELDRLYNRYGGLDRRKLGSVTGVKMDGFGVELSVTDLGNIFNRVPSVAPNEAPIYTDASQNDKIKWAYILDNDTLTPDETSEEGLGNFIIG